MRLDDTIVATARFLGVVERVTSVRLPEPWSQLVPSRPRREAGTALLALSARGGHQVISETLATTQAGLGGRRRAGKENTYSAWGDEHFFERLGERLDRDFPLGTPLADIAKSLAVPLPSRFWQDFTGSVAVLDGSARDRLAALLVRALALAWIARADEAR